MKLVPRCRRRHQALVLLCLALVWPDAGCTRNRGAVDAGVDAARDAAPVTDARSDGDGSGGADTDAAPPPRRVVALGDLHGDFGATEAALRAAGVMDESASWIGGTTTLVQVGDILDRGPEERRIIDLFESLRAQAAEVGGRVVNINGNHEVMNAEGDYRYVDPAACTEFADLEDLETERPEFGDLSRDCRRRAAAFWPGGPYALILAQWPVVFVDEDTVFVHGGLLPQHVDYGIDRVNEQVRDWLQGVGSQPVGMLSGDNAVCWSRTYSDPENPPTEAECEALRGVLESLSVERMVIAHSVQGEINSACDGAVWRIDVGIAAYYGGSTQVLELLDGEARVIRAE